MARLEAARSSWLHSLAAKPCSEGVLPVAELLDGEEAWKVPPVEVLNAAASPE